MLTERQQYLSMQTQIRKNCVRVKNGWKRIMHGRLRLTGLVFLCALILMAILGCKLYALKEGFAVVISNIWCCAIYMCSPIVILWYIILNGTPWRAESISDNLQRAGVVNDVDEPPILLERHSDSENDKVMTLVFQTIGIPMNLWMDKQLAVESALNAYVVKVQEDKELNKVRLHTVNSEGAFPDVVKWEDHYLKDEDGVLVIGVTVSGTLVEVDLSNTPHVLIGGSSGSGKSVLMGLMLLQTLRKNMTLYIADFKGGLDYNGVPWEGCCTLVTDIDAALTVLEDLVGELECRKKLLYDAACKNIAMYNNHTGERLPRIVFGCDEIAEVTDKSGVADKEMRAKIDKIIGYLSTIARQGRALGIHLILATQRPDANVLPGQIKNNIDFRACGRADNTLAMIILDNADAADKLPKDGHRFMLADGTIFLPYYWED